MLYTIQNFKNTRSNSHFISGHITNHFDWPELLQSIQSNKLFPHIITAHHTSNIIGMVLLHTEKDENVEHPKTAPTNSIWLHRLYVEEKYRGQNIGSALIKAAEQYTQQNGERELWLDTVQADRYYEEKLGYEYVYSAPYKGKMTKIYKKRLTD